MSIRATTSTEGRDPVKSSNKEFSGRRAATYIACAAIVSVGAPFSAYAATSVFSISDPVHATYKARVSATGRLMTDTSGSKVSVSGTVGIAGAVRTQPLAQPWHGNCYAAAHSCGIPVPAGHTLDLRTLSVFQVCGGTDPAYNQISLDNAGWTSTAAGPAVVVTPSPIGAGASIYTGTAQVDMPIVVPSAGIHQLIIIVHPDCQEVSLTAYGYLS